MMLTTIISKNGVPIRLNGERWRHIVLAHEEIQENDLPKIINVIYRPDYILKGSEGEYLAVKKIARKKSWLVVPYKEVSQKDGFVLTAYFSSNLTWLLKKEIVWNKQ